MIGTVRKLIDYARETNRRRLYRRRGRKLKHLEALDVQSRFEYIYDSNYWGNIESRSGGGSTLAATEMLRSGLEALLGELDVKILLDSPCGDWNWMRAVRFPPGMRYIGGDIVLTMVQALQEKHGSDAITFHHMNIIETPLPAATLWLCRDSLFHFSNADIFATLRNFLRSQTPYALLTSMPGITMNSDIMTGSYRPLNLLIKPFGFPEPRKILYDNHEKLRYLGLWHRDDITTLIEAHS